MRECDSQFRQGRGWEEVRACFVARIQDIIEQLATGDRWRSLLANRWFYKAETGDRWSIR